MNLKLFLLNENINQEKTIDTILKKYQSVKLNSIGWYEIYTCQKSETPGIFNIKNYTNKLKNDFIIDDYLNDVYYYCNDATKKLQKIGLSITPLKFIKIIIIEFDESILSKYNISVKSEEYYALTDIESNSILINKSEFKNNENITDLIIHETSHVIWELLSSDKKEMFINWYKENVLRKLSKEIKLDNNDILSIWERFIQYKGKIILENIKLLSKIIEDVLKQKYDDITQIAKIKSTIIENFKQEFRKNKNIFEDKNLFINKLKRIQGYKPANLGEISNIESAKLRTLAYDKGLTPSEYAATNYEELWSETIKFMSNNVISEDLRNIIEIILK